MARVLAVFDDLLLGSNVTGWLAVGGHETELAGASAARPDGHDVLVLDLADDGFDAVELVQRLRSEGSLGSARLLGVYSHVHVEQRRRAEAAGFDLVVPRSRMAREGAALVDGLAGA